MPLIEALAWDSSFFGFSIGRCCLQDVAEIDVLRSTSDTASFDLIYVEKENPSQSEIDILSESLPLMDRKVRFRKTVGSANAALPAEADCYREPLSEELLSLALESGTYSRFRLDPHLRPRFAKMYRAWIEKSLSGELADAVLVTRHHETLSGFVTLQKKEDTGHIGLLAVHPEMRGQGIGRKLMQATDAWFKDNQCAVAEVCTQLANAPACGLYAKSGYAIAIETAIFHWWNRSDADLSSNAKRA